MRHEWTDDEGVRWYAKDGTIYGAELGRVCYGADNEPYDEEVSEGDVESPLPAPAAEILRLVGFEKDFGEMAVALKCLPLPGHVQEKARSLAERERKLREALAPLLPILRERLASWEFSKERGALVGFELPHEVSISMDVVLTVEALRALLKEE